MSLSQHVGTNIKLLLHTVAIQIKALVISWDQLLYAFVENGLRQAFQLVLHNVFCLLVTPQTLAGQECLEVEKQVIITWCKVGTVWRRLENFPLELFE